MLDWLDRKQHRSMSGNKARHTTPQNKLRSPCRIDFLCGSRGSFPRGFFLSFADLVVIAKEFYPIPFRTRPSKPSASMVLRLKPRESRTLPGLPRAEIQETRQHNSRKPRTGNRAGLLFFTLLFFAFLAREIARDVRFSDPRGRKDPPQTAFPA